MLRSWKLFFCIEDVMKSDGAQTSHSQVHGLLYKIANLFPKVIAALTKPVS